MTGVRIGIIFQSISATIIGLAIGFAASWKITLVVLSFSPLMILSSKIRVQKESTDKKSKGKNSFAEQGGQVLYNFHSFMY